MPTFSFYSSSKNKSKQFFFIISGVGLSPLGAAATSGLLYKPQMIDEGDCGVIGGIKIGSGNRSTRRKPAPAPLCPPQIPHDQTRARTPGRRVGSQRITAWVMARPTKQTVTMANRVTQIWGTTSELQLNWWLKQWILNIYVPCKIFIMAVQNKTVILV
jgi:hypothetical protein